MEGEQVPVIRYGVVYIVLTVQVCLDEAQMVENTTVKAAKMMQRVTAVNRWCVTGTPVHRDLRGKQESAFKVVLDSLSLLPSPSLSSSILPFLTLLSLP